MSRYYTTSNDPNHEVYVGWDNPLESFFVQVIDPREDEEHEIVFWAGATPDKSIKTLAELLMTVAPWGGLPAEILRSLDADYENRRPPTAFQRKMKEIFKP